MCFFERGFDPRSQPDLRLVWQMWLFSETLRRGEFSSTAIEIIKWVNFFLQLQSHILRPGNTAFKEQLKLVNGFER
jgi:hypothetical protein